MTKESPILFNAPMVRAILEGRKTQTRRVVKPKQGGEIIAPAGNGIALEQLDESNFSTVIFPFGLVGDRLWVRETFCPIYPQDPHYNGGMPIEFDYFATYKHGDRMSDLMGEKKKWKPSIHMPRWASRIQLEITGVGVERLKDISVSDAIAEGYDGCYLSPVDPAIKWYADLWESINGVGSWNTNPWVWVIEFRRVK